MQKLLTFSLLIAFLSGCFKEEDPFLEDNADLNREFTFENIRNVAFLKNNEIYYLKKYNSVPEQLTFNTTIKSKFKMSLDREAFAYKDPLNVLTVYHKSTGSYSRLGSTSTFFKWANSSPNTLCYFDNGTLVQYGAKIELPPLEYPDHIASSTGVTFVRFLCLKRE